MFVWSGLGGPHLAVLEDYSWVYAQGSLLTALGDLLRCQAGIEHLTHSTISLALKPDFL